MATAKQMTPDESGEGKIFKTKNGQKMFNHARHVIHQRIGMENTVYYYLTELETEGISQSAPTMVFTNMVSLPNPFIYYGTDQYEKKKREYAKAVAAAFEEHHLTHADAATIAKWKENQALSGAKPEDVKEIEKSYLSFSHLLTLSPQEAARLSVQEQIKLLVDMRDYFEKRFTNQPECNHGVAAFPHIKWEKKEKQYKSHLHIEMTQMSFDRQKLDLHMSKERMNLILIEMENHPYFGKFLDKTNTLAAEKKFAPKTLEEKELFISLIKDVLGNPSMDVNQAHRALIEKGIKLTPHHVGTKLSDVKIEYAGRVISMNQLHERGDKTKTLIHKYFELKDLSTPAKKHVKTAIEDAKELIEEAAKAHSPQAFVAKLREHGLHLIPNVTKKGKVSGYSIYFEELNESIKLSTIGVKKDILPFDEFDSEHLSFLRKVKDSTNDLIEQHKPIDQKKKKQESRPVAIVAYGQRQTFYKVRRMMYEYKTIEDYMNEGLGGKYSIALKKNYQYVNGEFVNRRSNKTEFRVDEYTPEKSLALTYIGTSDHAAKAVIQMYLENGFKGIEIGKGGTIEQGKKLWRAAMLTAGPDFKVIGYTPTNDDLKWLEEYNAEQVKRVREANQKAIQAFAMDGEAFEFKTVSNQWKTVFREPLAYAFVDLLKEGQDPMLVMNPPKGNKAKNQATDDDMKEFYALIMKTVRMECSPEQIQQAEELLKAYKPEPLTVAPIEPTQPKPRTAEDVLSEHRQQKAVEEQKLAAEQELRRKQALDNAIKNKEIPD
ncbi:hypothetical protein K3Z84_00595 [Pseudomonas aeruginosa]|nr:hypothetical protein [Pseudomonas aeruginosa]